jgi:hypothetical protein
MMFKNIIRVFWWVDYMFNQITFLFKVNETLLMNASRYI